MSRIKPIFICGCDRSGTTMLGDLLGSSPFCITTPESQFVTDVLGWKKRQGSVETDELLDLIDRHWRFKIWGQPIDDAVRRKLTETDSSFADVIEVLVRRYAEQQGRAAPACWLDHTPTHVRWMDSLLEVFPEARFIHLVRDGRAVAASILSLDWGPHTISDAADWWAQKLAFGLAAPLGHADRVHLLRYEDLVCKPEDCLRQVCGFAGIPYEPAMLDGGGFRVPGYTVDQHRLVGRAPDASRLADWRNRLTPREIELFEARAGELLRYLGYEPDFGLAARSATRMERLAAIGQRIRGWFRGFRNRRRR